MKKYILIFFLFLLLLPSVFSQLDLPPGLVQLLEEQGRQVAAMNFLVALIGGVIALLSPCVLSITLAFIAVAGKERKNLTKTFGIFLLGVGIVSSLFALGGLGIGSFLRVHRYEIALGVGIVFLVWAVFIFLNKTIPFFKPNKDGNDLWGVFTFGALFAVGYTPCVFPISAAILVIGNNAFSSLNAAALMFMYTVGLFLPMMALALLYDYFHVSRVEWIRKNTLSLGPITTSIPSIVSALFFVFFGLLFVVFRGTFIFNAVDPAETMVLARFGQEWLLNLGISTTLGNVLGIVLLALLWYIFYKFVKNHRITAYER
ncbi:hypothetical protein CMO83_01090 [Candidatus Woesearchaeota archaeon]|jgi:cytochrome c biogenesis protein CcdA|nr:hypothetical protein [Candidatus Woesearchaeota archaeon]MDP6648461.1 cytochrome c biogenesis CcdA family protein [Candidatus Woesearchaeota archaeon]|tara:strand:+ start:34037 stop:34984 length:948 start_codon:yes stop_codon:yes gene_type:complete